ncbi:hypothetical protein [Viridibacterium curvum]|uniref:hypothetical protein n=1 Tax=Viridibacterium curvum TaxID=1101404 RepID=UPI0031EFA734
MNLFTGESSDEYFGGELTPAARRMLDQLATATPAEFESLLWTAQVSSPDCLPVYYLLYKYHASRRQFDLAEKAARSGLLHAAQQAGLPADWQAAEAGCADFSHTGPARFWLFTLKALAFILLRQGRTEEASAALNKIRQVHGGASGLGDDVIAALLEGSRN